MKPATKLLFTLLLLLIAIKPFGAHASPLCKTPLVYTSPGQVIATPKVYIDYWQWNGADPRNLKPAVEGLLNTIGGTKYFNVPYQYYGTVFGVYYYYTNPSNILQATWNDNTNTIPSYPCTPNMDGKGCTCSPLTCYLGPQAVDIGTEALRAVSAMHIDPNDPNTIVLVLGPQNVAFNNQGCAYHQAIANSTYPSEIRRHPVPERRFMRI